MLERVLWRLRGVRLTRRSLVRMALSIFGGFVLLSVAVAVIAPPSPAEHALDLYIDLGPREGERRLVEHLEEHPQDRETWLALVHLRSQVEAGAIPKRPATGQFLDPDLPPALEFHDATPYLDDAAFEAFLATCAILPAEVLSAWRDSHSIAFALGHLAALEDSLEAQLAGGEICLAHGEGAAPLAVGYFERARALSPGDRRAVTGWLNALDAAGREEEIAAALADPGVRAAADPRTLYHLHERRGELARGLIPLWRSQYDQIGPALWATVLVAGACWALLCFHLGHGWQWRRTLQVLVPVALALGWASAEATLAAVVYTDDWIGAEFHSGLAFSLLEALLIGVREETLKLLLFLPLVPYVARMGSDVQGLVLASLVGLGFAINENAGYFLQSEGHDILGRYLTANFAHMAMTGYAGYFLVRAVRRGGESRMEFLQAFGQVILVHAVYDLFLIAEELAEYGILSMVLFILISQQYLRLVFRIRPHVPQRVSATRIFVAALATVAGMNYFYFSTRLGIAEALWQTLGGLLGIGIIAFMYFQEFDERVA